MTNVVALAVISVAAVTANAAAQGQHAGHRPFSVAPSDDPYGGFIVEAAQRFSVPEQWIRRVMQAESAGVMLAVSSAGAMGLMQLMPDTYATMRARHSLGDNPYDPRDNILAGTAFIRELFDRYGAPGFLAAYNAGPARYEQYLANGRSLPPETLAFAAALTPAIEGTRLDSHAAVAFEVPPSPEQAPIFVVRRAGSLTESPAIRSNSLGADMSMLFADRRSIDRKPAGAMDDESLPAQASEHGAPAGTGAGGARHDARLFVATTRARGQQ